MKQLKNCALILTVLFIGLMVSSCLEPTVQNNPSSVTEKEVTSPQELPLDERSYQLLEKFAEKYPDTIYKGGVNFNEWISYENFLSEIQQLQPPVTITGICYRPSNINITKCTNGLQEIDSSSTNLNTTILAKVKNDATLYRTAMINSEFYNKKASNGLFNGDIEIGALIVEDSAQNLIALWNKLPYIKMICPGDDKIFPPLLNLPKESH